MNTKSIFLIYWEKSQFQRQVLKLLSQSSQCQISGSISSKSGAYVYLKKLFFSNILQNQLPRVKIGQNFQKNNYWDPKILLAASKRDLIFKPNWFSAILANNFSWVPTFGKWPDICEYELRKTQNTGFFEFDTQWF